MLEDTPQASAPVSDQPVVESPGVDAQSSSMEADLASDFSAARSAEPVESTPPIEGEPAESAPAEEAANERALLSYVATLPDGKGFADKYRTDYDFIQGAMNAQKLLGRRDSDAELGRVLRERPEEVLAHLQQRLQQGAPPQQQQQPADSTPPEYKEEWRYMVEPDEKGGLRPKAGAPADIVQKLQRATDFMEKRLKQLAYDPESVIRPYLEKVQQAAVQQAQQVAGSQMVNQQEAAQIQGWVEQNKNWMFINGDPNAGETAHGQRLAQHFNAVINDMTVKNPRKALGLAFALLQAESAQTRATPPRAAAHAKPNVAAPMRTEADEDAAVANETIEQSLRRTLLRERRR